MSSIFPPVELADENGLLAVGGELSTALLIEAYSHGIFPWPMGDELPLPWFSPDPRGILFYDRLHISKSLQKKLRQHPFNIHFNRNFEAVIGECQLAPYRKDTWITDEMKNAYIELNHRGFGFSVEAYDREDELVGGIYGVKIKSYYCGESMFFKESNASKVLLITLMNYLHDRGITWLDTQMVSPVVKSLGGVEIPRDHFLDLLNSTLGRQDQGP